MNVISIPLVPDEWAGGQINTDHQYTDTTLELRRVDGSGPQHAYARWGIIPSPLGGEGTGLEPVTAGTTYTLTGSVTTTADTGGEPARIAVGYVTNLWVQEDAITEIAGVDIPTGTTDEPINLTADIPPEAAGGYLVTKFDQTLTDTFNGPVLSDPDLQKFTEPDPEPVAAVADGVITISAGRQGDEYTIETEEPPLSELVTLGQDGAGSFDTAAWQLDPGHYIVNITGPYLSDIVLVTVEQEPDERLADALAPRVAAYVGRAGNPATEATAAAQIPIVAEFVKGYTRGSGWIDGGWPEAPLRAVIMSATGRLVLNPEQVRQYSAGEYSETPATLRGFTLAEQHVLNRYRKRWA